MSWTPEEFWTRFGRPHVDQFELDHGPRKMSIEDVIDESSKKYYADPPPSLDLGRDLRTFQDCERWLLHSSNHVRSRALLVHWDGVIPRLNVEVARRLIENPEDRPGLFATIIRDQYDKKHPKTDEKEPKKIEETP